MSKAEENSIKIDLKIGYLYIKENGDTQFINYAHADRDLDGDGKGPKRDRGDKGNKTFDLGKIGTTISRAGGRSVYMSVNTPYTNC